MDYIHIEKLVVSGKHGVYARERVVEQEFAFDLKLGVDMSAAAKSDDLASALDYGPVRDTVISIVQNNSYYLVEKLAEHIATEILKDTRVLSVEVSIRKPEAWDNGVPGVTITRVRARV